MLRRAALAGALIASVSCNRSEGGDGAGSALASNAGSGVPATSAGGGFSADLAKELAGPPSGAANGTGAAARAVDPAGAGSAAGDARPGSAAAGDPPGGGGKPASTTSEPAGKAKPGSGAAGGDRPEPGGKPASTTSEPAGKPSGGGTGPGGSGTPAAPPAAPAVAAGAPAGNPGGAPAHGPGKVPADLAAIKLSLLPNWDRDVDQPGTFQYVVRIKGTQNTKTFTFRYGYDDPRAPADRDQYKKYLQDTHALTGEIRDRQRGAAWFLEGSDAAGMPAFRYVVLYGGKRLICHGSLYKDADSNRLGDDRDQTLIQAKQICETLAL